MYHNHKKLKLPIRMNCNENPFGSSKSVFKSLLKDLEYINRYPDSNHKKIKEIFANKYCLNEKELFFGNGSDEIIDTIIKVFSNEGDVIIASSPNFITYKLSSNAQKRVFKSISVVEYKHDLQRISQEVTSATKIIFLSNPNNPTGTYINKREFETFLKKVNKEGLMIVIDSAYEEYVECNDFPYPVPYIKKYPNILVLKTFSKAHGLAGLRIGVLIAIEKHIDKLCAAKLVFNVNSLALSAAAATLADDGFLSNTVRLTRNEKKYLYNQLDKLNLQYVRSQTNFILIKPAGIGRVLFDECLKAGILVKKIYGGYLDHHIRVSVGTRLENEYFIYTLNKIEC